jgi:hypothetical protein
VLDGLQQLPDPPSGSLQKREVGEAGFLLLPSVLFPAHNFLPLADSLSPLHGWLEQCGAQRQGYNRGVSATVIGEVGDSVHIEVFLGLYHHHVAYTLS